MLYLTFENTHIETIWQVTYIGIFIGYYTEQKGNVLDTCIIYVPGTSYKNAGHESVAFLLSDDFSGSDDVNISSDIIFEATFDQNGEQLNSLTTSGEQLKDLAKSVPQVKGIVTSGNQVHSTLTSAQSGPGNFFILSMLEIFTSQLLQLMNPRNGNHHTLETIAMFWKHPLMPFIILPSTIWWSLLQMCHF